jgi:hypothetical protein
LFADNSILAFSVPQSGTNHSHQRMSKKVVSFSVLHLGTNHPHQGMKTKLTISLGTSFGKSSSLSMETSPEFITVFNHNHFKVYKTVFVDISQPWSSSLLKE